MKSKEEIEKLAESYLQKNKYNFDNWKEIEHVKKTFIDTYTQCQEDMADKKYTLKDLKEAFKQSRQAKIFEKDMPPVWESFEDYINSLNKQD